MNREITWSKMIRKKRKVERTAIANDETGFAEWKSGRGKRDERKRFWNGARRRV
jgi:hypothetical protein